MEFFAWIYENLWGIHTEDYSAIFRYLFDHWSYLWFFLLAILPSMALMALFYYAYPNPYAIWWHWAIAGGAALILSFIFTLIAANQIILAPNDPNLLNTIYSSQDYESYAESLPIKYALANLPLALLAALIFSLIARPFSKLQMHLPLNF